MIRDSRGILTPASLKEVINEYTLRVGLDVGRVVPSWIWDELAARQVHHHWSRNRMLTLFLMLYHGGLSVLLQSLERSPVRTSYIAGFMLGVVLTAVAYTYQSPFIPPTTAFDTDQFTRLVSNRLAMRMEEARTSSRTEAYGSYGLSPYAELPAELYPQVPVSAPPMVLALDDMPPDAWTVKTIPQPIAVAELDDDEVVIEEVVSADVVVKPEPTPLAEGIQYTIQQGDNLWQLAQDYDIEFKKIVQYNTMINPSRLQVGDKVYLPGVNDPYKRSDRMIFPVENLRRISSGYGLRKHPIGGNLRFHKGIDVSARRGTRILSVLDGRVISAGWHGDLGYAVRLQHANGIVTVYGHCSKLLVRKGQNVVQGQAIALVGRTGRTTGNHLHFEVWKEGKHLNPSRFLPVR